MSTKSITLYPWAFILVSPALSWSPSSPLVAVLALADNRLDGNHPHRLPPPSIPRVLLRKPRPRFARPAPCHPGTKAPPARHDPNPPAARLPTLTSKITEPKLQDHKPKAEHALLRSGVAVLLWYFPSVAHPQNPPRPLAEVQARWVRNGG